MWRRPFHTEWLALSPRSKKTPGLNQEPNGAFLCGPIFPVPGVFQVVRLPSTVQLIGYLVLDACEEGKCITELEIFPIGLCSHVRCVSSCFCVWCLLMVLLCSLVFFCILCYFYLFTVTCMSFPPLFVISQSGSVYNYSRVPLCQNITDPCV